MRSDNRIIARLRALCTYIPIRRVLFVFVARAKRATDEHRLGACTMRRARLRQPDVQKEHDLQKSKHAWKQVSQRRP